jgi:hypothetical protein
MVKNIKKYKKELEKMDRDEIPGHLEFIPHTFAFPG